MRVLAVHFAGEWIVVVEFVKDTANNFVAAQLVGRTEIGAMIEKLPLLIDNLGAKTMKGMNGDFIRARPDNLAEPLAHGTRAALGKCQAEDVFRECIRLFEDIGHSHT